MHILCTICSDLVNQAENIYVTKCGHIFHHHCLAQWIERSKSCPQCRNKVTDRCMFRLYPTISNENTSEDAATLQSRLDDAQLQLREQKTLYREKDEKLAELKADVKRSEDLLKSYEKKLVSRDSAVTALKEQLDYVKIQNKELSKAKEENENLKKNIQTLNGLQKVLNATSDDVENMLRGYTDLKTLAMFATALKRALCESESKKSELRDKLHSVKQQYSISKSYNNDLKTKIAELEERLSNSERKYQALSNKRKASEMNPANESSVKQPKNSEPLDLNITIMPEKNISLNSMVERIENADSPYLSLKQSSLALSALNRAPSIPADSIKPSEFAIINSARAHAAKSQTENVPLSIFHRRSPPKPEYSRFNTTQLDISYDGLGGHSKLDTFPKPKEKFKSFVPKVTAKHKLKRPSEITHPDISKMIKRLSNNKM